VSLEKAFEAYRDAKTRKEAEDAWAAMAQWLADDVPEDADLESAVETFVTGRDVPVKNLNAMD